jgi:hypothetical protein
MARKLLKQVRIAAPCHASWDSMKGDDRIRFCGECKLNVYNISEMTASEATGLIRGHEGRLCIRMYQRPDGTVISKNCPVGLTAMRRRLAYSISFVCAFMLTSFALAMGSLKPDFGKTNVVEQSRQLPVVGPVVNWLDPRPKPNPIVLMGDFIVAPTGTTHSSGP